MSELMNETELRRLAERRVDAKAGFWIHAAIFVVVNAGMALANWNAAPASPWFLWSAGCWGLALIVQGIAVYIPARDFRRRAVDAELARLRRARG
jgi:hypothetical protein